VVVVEEAQEDVVAEAAEEGAVDEHLEVPHLMLIL